MDVQDIFLNELKIKQEINDSTCYIYYAQSYPQARSDAKTNDQ
jgi:hypothetical protein